MSERAVKPGPKIHRYIVALLNAKSSIWYIYNQLINS